MMIASPGCKSYTYGTHRTCDPLATLSTIIPHFEALGLTRIADVTGLDTIGIPVCMAVRPNARSLSVSQGKGLTLALAKVSAAMEAIEYHHAETFAPVLTHSAYDKLRQQTLACDPAMLPLHPLSIYHEQLPISWIRGKDLLHGKDVFVPYDLVHCNLVSTPTPQPLFLISSNGLASGNHLLEAISHAICELVERDATVLWELDQAAPLLTAARYLDLATVDASTCQSLFEKIWQAGLVLHVWDQTSDVGIPSFGCVLLEPNPSTHWSSVGVFHGAGCHLSKEIALVRAVTEAVQSRLTFITGARDDMYRASYTLAQSALAHTRVREFFSQVSPTLDYSDLPSWHSSSFQEDIQLQLDLLEQAGFTQVVMVDLSQEAFGIPVARVLIPEMEFIPDKTLARYGHRAREHHHQTMLAHAAHHLLFPAASIERSE